MSVLCRLRLHRMVWDSHAYPGDYYMEPDEPGYICIWCEKTYPDAEPVMWRFWGWFYSETRLGEWIALKRWPER